MHVWPAEQTAPDPQWHWPALHVSPVGAQSAALAHPLHFPAMHDWLPGHTLPQAPQLFGSPAVLVQTPLQLVCRLAQQGVPDGQTPAQTPDTHA